MNNLDSENLTTVSILQSQAKIIEEIVKTGEFANISEFVVFAIRKELNFRKWLTDSDIVLGENQIKEKLESWIEEINKKAILDKKLDDKNKDVK